jgi:hypothetical protein
MERRSSRELISNFIGGEELTESFSRELVPVSRFVILVDRSVGNLFASPDLFDDACFGFVERNREARALGGV